MTLPDKAPARKPRRLGLIIPWGLAGLFALAWCIGWFWLEHETVRKMDAARAAIEKAGWRFDWTDRKVTGFPFRLNIDLTNARWGEASGWSVAAPVLKAQAYVSTTDHWTLVAPDGVVLTRTQGGPIHVSAEALRASLSHMDQHPPTISVEGLNLTFSAPRDAEPHVMTAAREFHFHTKAGPDDQGAFYVELDSLTLKDPGPHPRPTDFLVDALFTKAGALSGHDWAGAIRAWKAAGGALSVREVEFGSRPQFNPRSGVLTLGAQTITWGAAKDAGAGNPGSR